MFTFIRISGNENPGGHVHFSYPPSTERKVSDQNFVCSCGSLGITVRKEHFMIILSYNHQIISHNAFRMSFHLGLKLGFHLHRYARGYGYSKVRLLIFRKNNSFIEEFNGKVLCKGTAAVRTGCIGFGP